MWNFWMFLRVFLILIAFLGVVMFEKINKNEQQAEVPKGLTVKKEEVLLPKLSGFIVDELGLFGSIEKLKVSRTLRKIEEETPEKMRFIIYNHKSLTGSEEELDYTFAKKLFKFWDLKDTDVILVISIFKYSHKYEGKRTTWRLFKGRKVAYYFMENSTDPIAFEIRKYLKSGDYSGMFFSIASLLLSRVEGLNKELLP